MNIFVNPIYREIPYLLSQILNKILKYILYDQKEGFDFFEYFEATLKLIFCYLW